MLPSNLGIWLFGHMSAKTMCYAGAVPPGRAGGLVARVQRGWRDYLPPRPAETDVQTRLRKYESMFRRIENSGLARFV